MHLFSVLLFPLSIPNLDFISLLQLSPCSVYFKLIEDMSASKKSWILFWVCVHGWLKANKYSALKQEQTAFLTTKAQTHGFETQQSLVT